MTKRQLFATVLAAYVTGRAICSLSRAVSNAVTLTVLERNPEFRTFLNQQHKREQAIKNAVWPN